MTERQGKAQKAKYNMDEVSPPSWQRVGQGFLLSGPDFVRQLDVGSSCSLLTGTGDMFGCGPAVALTTANTLNFLFIKLSLADRGILDTPLTDQAAHRRLHV